MTSSVERKFKKLLAEADPDKLFSTLIAYAHDALEEIYVHDNQDKGVEMLNNFFKFTGEHFHQRKGVILLVTHQIILKFLNLSTKAQETVQREFNTASTINLMISSEIERCLKNYISDRNETYLKIAHDCSKELVNFNLELIDENYADNDLDIIKRNAKELKLGHMADKLEAQIKVKSEGEQ